MTKIIVTGTTLFCMFFLTDCATIMSHGPQTLPILTQPDGAECEITDIAAGKSIVKTRRSGSTLTCDIGIMVAKINIISARVIFAVKKRRQHNISNKAKK